MHCGAVFHPIVQSPISFHSNKMPLKLQSKQNVDSSQAFKYHWKCWQLLGVYPIKYCRFSYIYFSVICCSLPIVLTINLFCLDSVKDILANLAANASLIAVALKYINIVVQRKNILEVNNWISKLDSRASSQEEQQHLQSTIRSAHRLFRLLFVMFSATVSFSELASLASRGERLMYPAWYPFDWHASKWHYIAAHMHQFIVIFTAAFQTVPSDTFPAVYTMVLTSHVHALNIRLKKVGFDGKKTSEQNYKDLIQCIQDHQLLIQYYRTVQKITSAPIFFQFFVTAIETCITAVYVFFVESNYFETIYLALYFFSVILEIFLYCYYGNELIIESNQITAAIYSCNWMDQNAHFKKILIIFMQLTQKNMTIIAGGVTAVSLQSFISVLKSSYSLFAVLIRIT